MNFSDMSRREQKRVSEVLDSIAAGNEEYFDTLAERYEAEEQDSDERHARNAAFINSLYRGGGDASQGEED